ncbi:MAG TPA: hypothetical protein VK585_15905, partial [Jiangellaceae bacterium]|nr:hypothetical protein [Jiangellaceae bacterium]
MSEPVAAERLTAVPANEASCDDLAAIFGTTADSRRCQCQRAGGPRRRRAGGLGRGRAADGVPQAAHLSRPV